MSDAAVRQTAQARQSAAAAAGRVNELKVSGNLMRLETGLYCIVNKPMANADVQSANFLLANGFSGHGLQQSPAMGRGLSELVTYGSYKTLDLSPLGMERVLRNEPLLERAVI